MHVAAGVEGETRDLVRNCDGAVLALRDEQARGSRQGVARQLGVALLFDYFFLRPF